MRTICLASALVAGVAVVGCGDGTQHGGGAADLAIPDMTARDLLIPTACSPTDPMSDGTPCAAGCPAGTIGVNLDGACKCYLTCTVDPECSCDRFCDPVTRPDAGVVSGACLLGNAPGERCGVDGAGAPIFGNRFCAQLTMCINADAALMFRYCSYKCSAQADCPAQTTCQPTFVNGNPAGSACAYVQGTSDLGQACSASAPCKTGLLCDGTCRPQCDGPGGACASGTCTVLDDPASGKIVGYVCK